jgi:ATP-dependent helicase/DNAse subunit B
VALNLITGPANAEKAGAVLDAFRAEVARGSEPLLVVPTQPDVGHYRRELAGGGVVFGAEVLRFGWLVNEIARRCGVYGGALARLECERVAAASIEAADLHVLAPARTAAGGLGLARALADLAAELEEQRVDAGRLIVAMRAWAQAEPARAQYATELGALYAAYRDRLAALKRDDEPLRTARVLDALREQPGRWGRTPVFLYGFDELTPLQLDAVEALAQTDAPVTVSLTHEAGRAVFSARAATYERLVAVAGPNHTVLRAQRRHYASASREALHHLERELFESELEPARLFGGPAAPPSVDPGMAVELLEGGGPRAEAELVAATVARLVRDEGMAPDEVAVVVRRLENAGAIVRALGEAEIPYAFERRLAARGTALGRGLIALLRCSGPDGTAADLVAYLRTPGVVRQLDRVDRLEARARREGAASAAAARALWESDQWPIEAIDRVAAAAARGPGELVRRLAAEVSLLLAAPFRRASHVLAGPELLDARAAGALRGTLRRLGSLADADPALVPPGSELERMLAETVVFSGNEPGPGRVTITTPLRLRARRVRALIVTGLVERVFPAVERTDPLLGDAERSSLNAASGLRLRHHDDVLGRERFLFYSAVSRPTERLVLSWYAADDDGDPLVPSFFLDDVRELLAPAPPVRRRGLGETAWHADDYGPPSHRAARLAVAAARGDVAPKPRPIAALADERVLAAVSARGTWSASALELWLSCPVKWFVERLLSPQEIDPDAEALVRGRFAHEALERVIGGLGSDASGRAELTPRTLPHARELLRDALDALEGEHRISVNPQRLRAAVRRLEADLVGYLDHAANAGSTFAPRADLLEVKFGGREDNRPAASLGGGALPLTGRIDRVDVSPGGDQAIVYDYKGKTAPAHRRWLADGKLQMGLYMLAARELLGLDVVGGLYQPLGNADQPRPRGAIEEQADPGLDLVRTDRIAPDELDELLGDVLEAALEVVAEIRAGRLQPRPDTCGWAGSGCSYPSICRCEAT